MTPRGLLVVLAGAAIALVPFALSDYHRSTGAAVAVYVIAIVALELVTGYTGQISVGHGAFMAIGGYATAILTHDHGWNDLATLPVSAAAGLVAGIAAGLPALRLRGAHLALTTFGLALAVPQLAKNYPGFTGGSEGLALPAHGGLWLYGVAWTAAAVTLLCAWLPLRGRTGRAFRALRDSELAAAAFGVSPAVVKTGAFGLSAALAAVAGSIYVLVIGYVSPDIFGLQLSLYVLIGAVVAGLGSLWGVLVGAAFVELLPTWLTTSHGVAPDSVPVVFGVAVIAVVALLPRGAAGVIRSALGGRA